MKIRLGSPFLLEGKRKVDAESVCQSIAVSRCSWYHLICVSPGNSAQLSTGNGYLRKIRVVFKKFIGTVTTVIDLMLSTCVEDLCIHTCYELSLMWIDERGIHALDMQILRKMGGNEVGCDNYRSIKMCRRRMMNISNQSCRCDSVG